MEHSALYRVLPDPGIAAKVKLFSDAGTALATPVEQLKPLDGVLHDIVMSPASFPKNMPQLYDRNDYGVHIQRVAWPRLCLTWRFADYLCLDNAGRWVAVEVLRREAVRTVTRAAIEADLTPEQLHALDKLAADLAAVPLAGPAAYELAAHAAATSGNSPLFTWALQHHADSVKRAARIKGFTAPDDDVFNASRDDPAAVKMFVDARMKGFPSTPSFLIDLAELLASNTLRLPLLQWMVAHHFLTWDEAVFRVANCAPRAHNLDAIVWVFNGMAEPQGIMRPPTEDKCATCNRGISSFCCRWDFLLRVHANLTYDDTAIVEWVADRVFEMRRPAPAAKLQGPAAAEPLASGRKRSRT